MKTGSQYVVTYDNTNHATYTFYVKHNFDGGQTLTAGPYTLHAGCISGAMTATNNMVTSVSIAVGASTTNAYTFVNPTAQHAWCTAQTNTLYTTGDVPWTTGVRLTATGTQPYTSYDLDSTASGGTIQFKIYTTFQGTATFLSNTITITIVCTPTIISPAATTPQYLAAGSSSGFELPTYYSSNGAGCTV